MSERSVTHCTFVIERTYPVTPERVFAAFADPAQKRHWFAEGRVGTEHELEFRPWGRERTRSLMGENTPFPGTPLTNDSVYLDIVPNRRIVMAYTMTLGDKRFSASLATFDLLAMEGGTRLVFTEQGAYFEGADGPQMREEGWRQILDGLARALAR